MANVCMCVCGLRSNTSAQGSAQSTPVCAKTPAVPSFASTAGLYTLFEGLQELYKDVFDIPREMQLPQGSMKRACSQGLQS